MPDRIDIITKYNRGNINMDEIRQLIKLKIEYYNMYYRYLSKSKYLTYASILEELLDEIENIPESITKYVEEMEGNK